MPASGRNGNASTLVRSPSKMSVVSQKSSILIKKRKTVQVGFGDIESVNNEGLVSAVFSGQRNSVPLNARLKESPSRPKKSSLKAKNPTTPIAPTRNDIRNRQNSVISMLRTRDSQATVNTLGLSSISRNAASRRNSSLRIRTRAEEQARLDEITSYARNASMMRL